MAEYNPILSAPQGANKKPKRVGRGSSSGLGTTAGKGNKGQQSRSGGKTYVGGFVGLNENGNAELNIENSYFAGRAEGQGDVGGFVGYIEDASVKFVNSYSFVGEGENAIVGYVYDSKIKGANLFYASGSTSDYGTADFKKGDSIFLPANLGNIEFKGDFSTLVSTL